MNYTDRLHSALTDKKINQYMHDKLSKSVESGVDDDLFEQALDDACSASCLGVDSDQKYNAYFFISHLTDDLLKDTFHTKVDDDKKQHLHKFVLDNHNDCPVKDLTRFRMLLREWLDKEPKYKKAYPNISGRADREPTFDRGKWVDAAKVIYSLLKKENIDKEMALRLATADWDTDERIKFQHWLRYYESGNTEKYNVKIAQTKEAYDLDLNLPSQFLDPATRSNAMGLSAPYKPVKTQKELDTEKALLFKQRMRSRLRSLKKLLDHYNDILPHKSIEQLQNEIFSLDKSISKLDVYASLEGCVIRSANRMHKLGFIDGADLLFKCAEDPTTDHAPVEKAVIQSIPPQKADAPANTPLVKPTNSNVSLEMVIDRLEGLTKELKSRHLIRDLASVDILLNELGVSAFFPELSDSQSKLIEAYSYASNRVETVVSKLRGTGKAQARKPSPEAPAPPTAPAKLTTEEVKQQPVSQVKKELPKG